MKKNLIADLICGGTGGPTSLLPPLPSWLVSPGQSGGETQVQGAESRPLIGPDHRDTVLSLADFRGSVQEKDLLEQYLSYVICIICN